MNYPGRIIKMGELNESLVKQIKRKLNEALALAKNAALKIDTANPKFGDTTKQAVMLFQSQHVDSLGRPLKVDGQVGSLTWEALFGSASVSRATVVTDMYLARVLAAAGTAADAKVREKPSNSNRGPEVEQYLRLVGKPPGLAWCVAFVYHCFEVAAQETGRVNAMVRTAGVIDHWNRCVKEKNAKRLPAARAKADPALVCPGMVFVMDHGGGLGHSGLVETVEGGILHTIEGNTDASKTREGGGVYRLQRKVADINKGYIDYSGL